MSVAESHSASWTGGWQLAVPLREPSWLLVVQNWHCPTRQALGDVSLHLFVGWVFLFISFHLNFIFPVV